MIGTVASLTREKNHGMLLDAAHASATSDRPPRTSSGSARARTRARSRAPGCAERGLERRVHLLGFRSRRAGTRRPVHPLRVASRRGGHLAPPCSMRRHSASRSWRPPSGGFPRSCTTGRRAARSRGRSRRAWRRPSRGARAIPNARLEWANRARETAAGFSADRMVERTIAEYDRLLSERTPE